MEDLQLLCLAIRQYLAHDVVLGLSSRPGCPLRTSEEAVGAQH